MSAAKRLSHWATILPAASVVASLMLDMTMARKRRERLGRGGGEEKEKEESKKEKKKKKMVVVKCGPARMGERYKSRTQIRPGLASC